MAEETKWSVVRSRVRMVARVVASALVAVAFGVATNQVISDNKLSWTWWYFALCLGVLTFLLSEVGLSLPAESARQQPMQGADRNPSSNQDESDLLTSGLVLDKFTVNGHSRAIDGTPEVNQRVSIWLHATGGAEVIITGIRIKHIKGRQRSIGTGIRKPVAKYRFPYRENEGPTSYQLDPAVSIDPKDQSTINLELNLYGVGNFANSGGSISVVLLYHIPGSGEGELPIERLCDHWRKLVNTIGNAVPLHFPSVQGVAYLMPHGGIRGTAPAANCFDAFEYVGQLAPRPVAISKGWQPDSERRQILREAATSVDPEMRKWGVWALGELKAFEDLPYIRQALHDDVDDVIVEAVEVISDFCRWRDSLIWTQDDSLIWMQIDSLCDHPSFSVSSAASVLLLMRQYGEF